MLYYMHTYNYKTTDNNNYALEASAQVFDLSRSFKQGAKNNSPVAAFLIVPIETMIQSSVTATENIYQYVSDLYIVINGRART